MRFAFVAFDGMTALDLVGAFDPLTRLGTMGFLEGLEWEVVAPAEEVAARAGLRLRADRIRPDLSGYDLVLVPGGGGTRQLVRDDAFLGWLRTAADVPLKASVCTGALLLGAAGFLEGLRAATHPRARDELRAYGVEVVEDRVVDAGRVITCGGVTAAIDLGLALCERFAGAGAAQEIARQMDYLRGA